MRSLPQHAADSDVWVTEYLTPSWVILPNDQPVLAIIQPGEMTLEALESVCKVNTQTYMRTNIHTLTGQHRPEGIASKL